MKSSPSLASHAMTSTHDHLSGKISSFFTTWIVDNGASNHMVSSSTILNSHTIIPFDRPIKLPNDTSLLISYIGEVKVHDDITLYNVLWIPNFICNLLSVSKLTIDLSCAIIFFF